ncbi:interferon alpha/beta receptor 2-like isoform X2 [Cetorhinus maximus]
MMFKIVGLLYLHQFLNSVIAVLLPPVNLSFTSENFHHILMWEAETDTPNNTRYTVEYFALSTLGSENYRPVENQTDDQKIPWFPAQNCSLITNRTCDLTNDFTNIYESYFAQVKAVTEMDESNWAPSEEFQPLQDTKIRPVNVHLSEIPFGVLKVNFDLPAVPPYLRDLGFKSLIAIHLALYYHITVFKNGELEEVRDMIGRTEEISVKERIENVQPDTSYCIAVKVFAYEEDHSDPMEMKCIVTQYERDLKASQTPLIFILCILGVGWLIVIVVLYKGGYLCFLIKYGPQALNNLKHTQPVYNCNTAQEKLSTLEHICFKEKKIENIEESSEDELMNSDQEAGYEPNSFAIPAQNSAQSSSASSKIGTDETSTMSCDDQLCDSVPEQFFTNLSDCQMAPTDIMQNECPDAETTSQTQTIHSRRSSSASASINVSNVPLWSIQIQDPDSCFVDFSNENVCDQEAHEPEIAEYDDLNNPLLFKVCDNAAIYQYEKPSLCDMPGTASPPQALHSDYMRR